MEFNIFEIGIAGAALIAVHKALDVVKQTYLHNKVKDFSVSASVPTMTPLACQVDPRHFERIKDIAKSVSDMDKGIARGDFHCAWQGRDEIRDVLDSLRSVAAELKALREELRLTRNGYNKGNG